MLVNQLQGSATVLQQGSTNFTLSQVNFNGKVEAVSTINLTGEYAGMIRQEQSLWIFTYNRMDEGSTITASVYDEKQAKVLEEITYSFDAELKEPAIIKNDNEYMTLVSLNSFSDDEIVYALLNYEGEIIHETIF